MGTGAWDCQYRDGTMARHANSELNAIGRVLLLLIILAVLAILVFYDFPFSLSGSD
jgi:hypothetical protein